MHVAPECRAASFARRAQLASLMLLGCVSLACAADKVAPKLIEAVSDDFLEYLGSLEGNDDTWMDFAADAATADPTRDPAKSESAAKDRKTVANDGSSSAASLTTKAASTTTGKADK